MSTVSPAGREILIVGAGPTGLTLACELYRHGVACKLIDAGPGPSDESRALGIHSRTLEVFEDMEVLDAFLERGRKMHGMNVYADGKRIVHLSMDELDAPYPFILSLPQSETEQLLIEQLGRLGGAVEWNTKLTAFSQDEDRVSATLVGPDTETEQFVGWLVGCDGAHSVVRKGLGLAFEGSAYEERLALADATLDGPVPRDEGHVWFNGDGVLLVFPLPSGDTVRLVAQLPPDQVLSDPSLEWFQAQLDAHAPKLKLTLSEPTWLSTFAVHRRLASAYRVGRTLICGDAAHVHSPVGGQGMNTGIQDAYNLGWKLALVVRGESPSSLIDSYELERRPVANQVLALTDRGMKAVTLRHPVGQALRNRMGAFFSQFEVVQRRLRQNASQLALNYRRSPLVAESRTSLLQTKLVSAENSETASVRDWLDFGAAPAPGDRAPDAICGDVRLFQILKGVHHRLLLFDGAAPTPAGYANLGAISDVIRERYGERIHVHVVVPSLTRPAGLDESVNVLHDPDGTLHNRYGAGAECLYLIRPDGYVGYRAQPADIDPLCRFLERVFSV